MRFLQLRTQQPAVGQLRDDAIGNAASLPGADTNSTAIRHTSAPWPLAVELYLQGEPRSAAELLREDDPAMMSARASLLWEAGFPTEAREIWTGLTQRYPQSRYALVGRYALDSADY